MPTYSLAIQFDDAGLNAINAAGQKVTIVKSVGSSGGSGSAVAWVSFQPMQDNAVTWTETYSVYASTTQVQNGAQITTLSKQTAAGGNTYTFANGQFGSKSSSNLPASEYGVFNNDHGFVINGVAMVTTGLYQGVSVNGRPTQSPLNAMGLLFNETAVFTPIEKVQVFVSSYQNDGLVIGEVTSEALPVDFTTSLAQTIYYNDATDQFEPGSLPG